MSLQTDTCNTLYVTKNTLTAYTIAVVQNAQALQYDQMHAALQTGRNQSSLETPLRAEELLTAHFNLAVLEDKTITDTSPDAKKSPDNTQDPDPSTSAPDDQTYVKIPSRYAENSATRRPHPTGAVAPTCRRDYRLVNAIPAGYESDDSWDNLSHNHDHTHMHNIVPLLTLRPWRNSARRGPEQQQFRQQSATNVRSGNAPYSRPWDNQPYGRRTRSQQALLARATIKYNTGIHYNRLIERRCASLDLEAAFKEIQISRDIEKQVCKECKAEFCRCPAFTPGTPCSSASSTPISTSDEQIPELVANKPVQQLHLHVQTPSDEEADREVAVICRPSKQYRVRSHLRRRRNQSIK